MGTLGHNFSGIVINQNNSKNIEFDWLASPYWGHWLYQTFTLPKRYQRGRHRPDLSGFQIYTTIKDHHEQAASLGWVLEYYQTSKGWVTLTNGTTIGTVTSGNLWFDVIFPKTVGVTEEIANSPMRIGIALPNGSSIDDPIDQPVIYQNGLYIIGNKSYQATLTEGVPVLATVDNHPAFLLQQNGQVTYSFQEGIQSLWYSTPTASSKFEVGPVYRSDGVTPLVDATVALNFRLLGLVGDSGKNFLGNEYRSAIIQTISDNTDTTGGTGGGPAPVTGSGQAPYWMSPPLPSKFAVQSIYFDMRNAADNAVVVDSVLVDPVTPNMAFNVYYSQDDTGTSDTMAETDWEQKLWTHVPQVYLCTQRQQYVFPEPVLAKYIKVEFTNLQAQSYDPGPFNQPVVYKKYPTWVANFFITQMSLPSFVSDQVNVQYDALQFAYNYYLDDLGMEPNTPLAAPTEALHQLTDYFITNATTGIDAIALSQVNLVMNQYRQTPDINVDRATMLGQLITGIYAATSPPTQTSEGGILPRVNLSAVSSINRAPVVFEHLLPVMYFFVPCRHGYKELAATLDHNKAYFAGVNEIAFLRDDYKIAADTPLYIENGGDNANIERSDFVVDFESGVWFTY